MQGVLWVIGGHPGGIKEQKKGPMRPKTSFFGHKLVWWLQSGGTVWNKGGTSPYTSVVMHRNSFVGEVGHRARPHRLQNC